MGFWDREVDGLVALGITLSQGQLRLLEEGGEGLALRVLPDPSHFQCCEMPYLDTNQDLTLFLAPMTVYAPDDVATYEGSTVAAVADNWWGDDWSRWPSVLGEIEDVGEGIWGSQELFAVRAWSVEEADDDRQHRFARASRAWLRATDYEPLAYINHEFASGMDSGEEPCRQPCKYRGDDEHYCLDEDEVENAGFWKSVWHLQDAGYATEYGGFSDPPVPPFETALTDPDDLEYFARLKRRSRQAAVNARAGIRQSQRSVYMKQEGYFEPWY